MEERREFLKKALIAGLAFCAGAKALPSRSLATSGTEGTYLVKAGDTLSHIAQRNGTSVANIKRWNQLKADTIFTGQKLIVAGGDRIELYTVKRGDNLSVIAARYGVSIASLRQGNQLVGDRIFPGQQLVITYPNSGVSDSYTFISGAVEATQRIRIQPGRWEYIVCHHSGIDRGNAASYNRFHREERNMVNGLAYHFVIGNGRDSGDGEVEVGDRWVKQLQGGHVRNFRINQIGIGICLVGNFQQQRPTPNQQGALIELLDYLNHGVLDGKARFAVHKEIDLNHTLCPGRNFP
ncbi:MAG: LysM peptidoglycan-binding domain-containing protein, partial [Opitutales bacterium]